MNKEQWKWMQASVALMDTAVAAMALADRAKLMTEEMLTPPKQVVCD